MKKYVKIILIVFIIVNTLLINVSYGICNTLRTYKRVSAVRLTLGNGQVLNDFTVDRNDIISENGTLDYLQTQEAKKLELIFVIDTNTSDLDAEKAIIENAISNFATFYEKDTSKLSIGIIGFNDEYKNYDNDDDFNYNLKNYKDNLSEIEEELNNLSSMRKS